jgi:hypothetical protein
MENEIGFFEKHSTKIKVIAGVTVGIVVGIVLAKNGDVLTNSFKQNNIAMLGGKNVIHTDLVRRGHPGFMVKDLTTGVAYPSLNYTMEQLNISHTELKKKIEEGTIKVLGEMK